jgi:hypothetical protein
MPPRSKAWSHPIIVFVCAAMTLGGDVGTVELVVAQSAPPVNFAIMFDHYYGGLYTSAPIGGARHVYYVGEPIDVVVDIGNAGDVEQSLDTRGVSMIDAFAVSGPQEQGHGIARLDLSPTGASAIGDNQLDVTWGEVITLGARSRVVWEGHFHGPSTPGVYEWAIEIRGIRASSPVNALSDRLRYELRQVGNFDDRAEVARRRLIRAYDGENDAETEAAVRALLNIYPESSLAYELSGRVLEGSGRLKEARAVYEKALALLTDRKDRLFLTHNNERDIASVVSSLRQEVTHVR